jgi:hypothetical protein
LRNSIAVTYTIIGEKMSHLLFTSITKQNHSIHRRPSKRAWGRGGILLVAVLAALILSGFLWSPAHAILCVVDPGGGGTHLTIQDAVDDAACEPIVIVAGTYVENVVISRDVTLLGSGMGTTIIDGGGVDTAVLINDPSATVYMSDLRITNGAAVDGGGVYNWGTLYMLRTRVHGNTVTSGGGGIYNRGTLTLEDSFIQGNDAPSYVGGGIYNGPYASVLTIIDSQITYNTAGAGGGIYAGDEDNIITIEDSIIAYNIGTVITAAGGGINSNGIINITNSKIFGNEAFTGAGVYVSGDGNLFMEDSTVGGNETVNGGAGGGIYGAEALFDAPNAASLTITSSLIKNNIGFGDGGGIYSSGALTMTNSTVSGNSAGSDGGGIYVHAGPILLDSVTVTNNSAHTNPIAYATGDGGGIADPFGSYVEVTNSIIAGNFDFTTPVFWWDIHPDCSGNYLSGGYNLIGDDSGCIGFFNGVNFDQAGTSLAPINPLLAPLANYGGPTQTHRLQAGSLAINTGNPACPATDQRGQPRPAPLGMGCDTGAFERQIP